MGGRASPQSITSSIRASIRDRRNLFIKCSLLLKYGMYERCLLFSSGKERLQWLKGLRVHIRAYIKAQKRTQVTKPLFTAFQSAFQENIKSLQFKTFNPQERIYKYEATEIRAMRQVQKIYVHYEQRQLRVHFTFKKREEEEEQPKPFIFSNNQYLMADIMEKFNKIPCFAASRGTLLIHVAPLIYGKLVKPLEFKSVRAKMQRWAHLRSIQGRYFQSDMDADTFHEEEWVNSKKEQFYLYSRKGISPKKEEDLMEDLERSLTPVQQFKEHDFRAIKDSGLLSMNSRMDDSFQVVNMIESRIDNYLKSVKKQLLNRNSFTNITSLTSVCDKLMQQHIYFQYRLVREVKKFRRSNKKRGRRQAKTKRKMASMAEAMRKRNTLNLVQDPKKLYSSSSMGGLVNTKFSHNLQISKGEGPLKFMGESMKSIPREGGFDTSKREIKLENYRVRYVERVESDDEEVHRRDSKRHQIVRKIRHYKDGFELYEEDIMVPPLKKRDEFCHYCDIF